MKKFTLNVNINQLLNITQIQPDAAHLTFIFNIDNNQVLVLIKHEDLIDFIKYITVNSTDKSDVR